MDHNRVEPFCLDAKELMALLQIISKLDIFPLIALSDIVSINLMTLI